MTEQRIILYIEDNLDNQQLVQRVLEDRGYKVVVADDGLNGIALARDMHPVLILVDINIPSMDGYETTTILRGMSHLHDVPIVALTADTSPGARERALVAGCDGYLAKPVRPHAFIEQVNEFIAGKRECLPPTVEVVMLREYNQKIVLHLEERVRALMLANAELQEGDRLKNQFLTTLSHELRTPLTSLLGYLDLFSRGTLGPINDIQHDAIGVMQRNVETLSQQLNNLLYLQEYRSNPLALVPVLISDMVEYVLKRMRIKAQKAEVGLHVEVPTIAPIRADPSALELVISNLLDNAIKYNAAGGKVLLSLHDEPGRVLMRVEDTGTGIAPSLLEKIFLPFFRVDHSLAGPQPGSGIGLALVKHIVEAHGGQVTVRSVLGQGTTFLVVLPRR